MVGIPKTSDVNLHIGRRLRRRRKLMGLSQATLGESVGTQFQQIQKYECAANKVSASRLFEIAAALNIPVNYFYEGLPGYIAPYSTTHLHAIDVVSDTTLALAQEIAGLKPSVQQKLLGFVRALKEDELPAHKAVQAA